MKLHTEATSSLSVAISLTTPLTNTDEGSYARWVKTIYDTPGAEVVLCFNAIQLYGDMQGTKPEEEMIALVLGNVSSPVQIDLYIDDVRFFKDSGSECP
jgi:hypothetical protein